MRDLVRSRGWELSAAELHGSLCGFLSARGELVGLQWLDAVLDQPVSKALVDSERQVLAALTADTHQALNEGEYSFNPLLPDDDSALSERVVALGQWCDGFVGGLGLGGMNRQHGLSATGEEAIDDLARIARTELTLDDDSEGDEVAFAEVLEFVRIGAVLVYEELRAGPLGRTRVGHGRHRAH